jgi:hypothetical protein
MHNTYMVEPRKEKKMSKGILRGNFRIAASFAALLTLSTVYGVHAQSGVGTDALTTGSARVPIQTTVGESASVETHTADYGWGTFDFNRTSIEYQRPGLFNKTVDHETWG